MIGSIGYASLDNWLTIAIFIQMLSEWYPVFDYVSDWMESKDAIVEQ
jgi:hypothetical protein